ncbi:MAG TPA: AIR synthase related protein, partial [Niastella sp.]|nr:AIR synthase related protein [Niastella sp.]
GKEASVKKVFEKWDLPCSHIGEVTNDGLLQFYLDGDLEATLPANELVLGGGAPQYERTFNKPRYLEKIESFNQANIPDLTNCKEVAEKLIALPNIASKQWIYNQYDSMVGAGNTNSNGPSDAAVVIAKPTNKALALTTDCNSRYVYADPYKGAMIAVAEAARNIVCSGGQPLGVTNCLNFGNPYDPEVYYQFVNAIKGMGEACVRFETPVTGGNVSFYNQSPDGPVYPTPPIGMVGLLESVNEKMTLDLKTPGDIIFLVGKCVDDICSSEYLHKLLQVEFSPAPYFNLEEEYNMQQAVSLLIKNELVVSAHDVSEGGLLITLFESSFVNNLGFKVNDHESLRKDAWWFGEAQGRVVVSVKPQVRDRFVQQMGTAKTPFLEIGQVTDGKVFINNEDWGFSGDWKEKYDHAIGDFLNKEQSADALTPL